MNLDGHRVVITGGSSSIGAATAIAFAEAGAQLVLGARGVDGLEAVARQCREAGGTAAARSIDSTEAGAVAAFAKEVRMRAGSSAGSTRSPLSPWVWPPWSAR